MTQHLHHNVLNNTAQMTNYYSVEIAEFFKDCPTGQDISAIERLLKQYRQQILTQQKLAA